MTAAKTRRRRSTGTAPDDRCPACGGPLRQRADEAFFFVNGERIRVPAVARLTCARCGEAVFSLAEARELQRRAVEQYRRTHDLLSVDEIRAIRARHDLTQGELARLLRLGANTISRWEAGRNVQSASMDVLLRLIRDLPGSLQFLRDHAA